MFLVCLLNVHIVHLWADFAWVAPAACFPHGIFRPIGFPYPSSSLTRFGRSRDLGSVLKVVPFRIPRFLSSLCGSISASGSLSQTRRAWTHLGPDR